MEEKTFAEVDYLFAKSLLKTVPRACEKALAQIAAVMAASREGHLCVRVEDVSVLPDELVERVDRDGGVPEKPLSLYGDLLYLQKNWIFESCVAGEIKRLQNFSPLSGTEIGDLPSTLLLEQKEAVRSALTAPVSLITGGPGTGKTFVAAQIYTQLCEKCGLAEGTRVALAAPTGKAASLLKDVCSNGFVGTLHALLGVRPGMQHSPKPLQYDLIIVDECSMVDASLFAQLLSAIKEGTHLVLMGDPNQLPPVEAGSLFADLVALKVFPTSQLKKCMRTDRSLLLTLREKICDGKDKEVLEIIEKESLCLDLGFSTNKIAPIYENLWQVVKKRFSVVFQKKPQNAVLQETLQSFRILSCLRKGPLGVDMLNQMLVKRFYMQAMVGSYLALPILITQTNLELTLYNGQMGILLKQVRNQDNPLDLAEDDAVVFPDRVLSALLIPHFEYAFCLSVHKSQGSEYDSVLLLVPQGSENFGREVLYTAVTRAKKELFIDGDIEIIKQAIATSSRRQSGLNYFLSSTLQLF